MTTSSPAITSLSKLQDKLQSPRDREFASSLIQQFNQRGSLSPKQWEWVGKLVERAVEYKPAPKPKADVSVLYDMFAKAGEKLKRPRLTFGFEGQELTVSPAAATSQNAGMLYIKLDGTYAGKVGRDGEVKTAFGVHPSTATSIAALINRFAEDPVGEAKAYGRATGSCCFCARPLTDTRSVDVGYGPICAINWGLPWGE